MISALCAGAQNRLQQLLTEEQLEDRKPSQFLRSLQQLLGDETVDDALALPGQLSPQRFPTQFRTAVDLTLNQQARLAD